MGFVNVGAAGTFRVNLWVKRACPINYEMLAIYILLQQTLICCHLPRLWPAQPVQLVVDS